MPKDNCDSRVTFDVSRSCGLLRIPFESNIGLCSINSFGISPCHQVSMGSIDLWHHSMTSNQESFTWSHTKVWQSIAILQWGARSIPKPYVFMLCRIIEIFKKKRENPRINISVDWLKFKWLHCHHSKIVKWLNQSKHTLWGSPQRDLQKDRERSHELSRLSERDSQSVFSTKRKKKKQKKQIKIKTIKVGKNVMSITQFSGFKTFCITSISRWRLHASASQKSCSYYAISVYISLHIPISQI